MPKVKTVEKEVKAEKEEEVGDDQALLGHQREQHHLGSAGSLPPYGYHYVPVPYPLPYYPPHPQMQGVAMSASQNNRLEPYPPYNPQHRRHTYSRPSPPPPISTLPSDSSSSRHSPVEYNSSAPPPPPNHSYYPQNSYPPPPSSSAQPYSASSSPPYPQNTYPPPQPNSYPSYPSNQPYSQQQPYPNGGGYAGSYNGPPSTQPSYQITYTDDASTKLNDRTRRRCFNCCTTDTSTWRRSNLSPGKVLCNKCGLFERTHSRPRPEQFPHKRGPLAATSLKPTPSVSAPLPPPPARPPSSGPQQQQQQQAPPQQKNVYPQTSNNADKLPSIANLVADNYPSSAPPPPTSASGPQRGSSTRPKVEADSEAD